MIWMYRVHTAAPVHALLLCAQISKLESQLRAAREAQDVRIRDVSGRADRVADEVEGLKSAASTRLAEVSGQGVLAPA
jgi:hypothetical protein